jgi:hypothetical protein
MNTYNPPVDQLLRLGAVQNARNWEDYRALSISAADIPELIRMATDLELSNAGPDNPEVWAPLHAWRALAQLRASEAIQPLVDLLDDLAEDEWFTEDLPQVMEALGPRTMAPLAAYLNRYDNSDDHPGYIDAVLSMARVAKKYPEVRSPCIQALMKHLANYLENDDGFNGWLIDSLLELQVRKALPLIAAALDQESVDEWIVDWDTVKETFQLPPHALPADFAAEQAL